jgi:hypothetical protein
LLRVHLDAICPYRLAWAGKGMIWSLLTDCNQSTPPYYPIKLRIATVIHLKSCLLRRLIMYMLTFDFFFRLKWVLNTCWILACFIKMTHVVLYYQKQHITEKITKQN